ncbi:WXG100 family type VII secretion target [Paenibacillus sp. P96]|uniref:WXG100 family type VII secretion target n=1 Tax=Paenibacillus zeirhizosphaerae TaxID=2987519 RepID=A0ABT9FRR9_9BACL|nr:WXG100 family type VII secretion target [Paenibacillus sp. P96]MDP4097428.1 WXG100 family type VII secretion target [Paenibacillus sp. P96]
MHMRIRVEPDVLRTLSGQLQSAAEQIQQITSGLEQALQSLEWEVSAREAVMDQWIQGKRLSEQIHVGLRLLGSQLSSKADQFQAADHSYNTILDSVNLGRPTALFQQTISSSPSILSNSDQNIGRISDPQSVISVIGGRGADSDAQVSDSILKLASLQQPQDWRFADPTYNRNEPAASVR